MASNINRNHVVDVAHELFYRRGIQSVGMDELCRTAGVSRKTFYTMFASKDALVVEVITRWHSMFMAGVRATTDAADSPRDRMLAIYDFLGNWFESDAFRGCGFINAFGELGTVSPAVAQIARDHKKSFQQHVAELVENAGAAEWLGPQLAILAEGAITTAAISGKTESARQSRDAAEILINVALAA